MLGWLKRMFGRRARPRRRVRARFDAAQTSAENRRHWANADALSANAAHDPAVRRTLRNRARYETANNSYAKGIVLTLANDLIGTGPRLQMLTPDDTTNRLVEREFTKWAVAVRLAERLRTMRHARAMDGEAFALFATNPRLPTRVQLDLRLLEADQVATPDLSALQSTQPVVTDGIEFDAFGNPTAYHVLRAHPGEIGFAGLAAFEADRVPAAAMLHYFRADRPGQTRGIPDVTPALPLFAQLRRYTLATIAAAETAATFAGVLYTDSPADGTEEGEAFDAVELELRHLLTLPGGWQMAQMKAEQPTTTYGMFKKEILNEIARCLNMPYNVAAGDSSNYNYASGRLDTQVYYKSLRVEQSLLAATVLDPTLAAWLNEAVLIEGYLPNSLRTLDAEFPHQWFWDGSEHVDPSKEATAQQIRLANHTTTLAHEYARTGRDWETEIRQRARELALMTELGLTLPTPSPVPADEEDDVEPVRPQETAA